MLGVARELFYKPAISLIDAGEEYGHIQENKVSINGYSLQAMSVS